MTKTDPNESMAEIDLARKDGYARIVGETIAGEVTIAAAIIDNKGRPIAAVHLSSNVAHWNPDEYRDRYAMLVSEVAHSLSDFRA